MLKHCSSFIPISQTMTATWKTKKNSRKLHLTEHQGKVSPQKNLFHCPGQVWQQVPPVQSLGEETSKYSLKLGFLNGLMEPWKWFPSLAYVQWLQICTEMRTFQQKLMKKILVNYQMWPNDWIWEAVKVRRLPESCKSSLRNNRKLRTSYSCQVWE